MRSIALRSFLATVSQRAKAVGTLFGKPNRRGGFAFWVTVDSIRRMTPEELFTAALGLGRQWRVAECRFEGEPKRLELRLEHVPGEHFECPVCKASCGVHDTIERRWRHMNFFQYRCELVAKVPRTWCRTDGVHQVPVPWAREGSGFTLMMEALMMLLSAEMPVDAMADLLDEHDTRLWRVLMHYVEQAHAKSDWSAVRRIAVDETSARRGRRYVTNVLDAENSRLLLMVEGRGVQALGAFAEALRRARRRSLPDRGDRDGYEHLLYERSDANTFLRPGSSSTSSTSWCWPAKPSRRCASNCSAREPISKGRCGACAATLGISVQERQEQRKNLCRQYTQTWPCDESA